MKGTYKENKPRWKTMHCLFALVHTDAASTSWASYSVRIHSSWLGPLARKDGIAAASVYLGLVVGLGSSRPFCPFPFLTYTSVRRRFVW